MNFLRSVGRYTLGFLATAGRISWFTGTALMHAVRPPFYPRIILKQMIEISYFSLPVVGLTAVFAGMVLALQSFTGFARFSAEGAVANVVVLSITRELGPVLAGLMVSGRIGASMAAENGTMRVTEQVDALTTLSTNPFKYLVAPRFIAGITMLPILVFIACGHLVEWGVGDREQQNPDPVIGIANLLVERGDPITDPPHRQNEPLGVAAVTLDLADAL